VRKLSLQVAPDTEILHIPVSKYESALDLACILEKRPEEIRGHDLSLCQTFLDRRIRCVGYPKVAFAEKIKVFKQHFAPGAKLEVDKVKASDMLICCYAEELPYWAKTKHILAESRGTTIGLLIPTEIRGRPASLLTYIGLSKP
jgi:hypothetical protein